LQAEHEWRERGAVVEPGRALHFEDREMTVQTAALGLVGSATTMLTRRAARKAMYNREGKPRLPRAARDNNGFVMFLVLAAATGVIFAIADVLQEQRKQRARAEGEAWEASGAR
jgi:hypothetical protein